LRRGNLALKPVNGVHCSRPTGVLFLHAMSCLITGYLWCKLHSFASVDVLTTM